MRDQKPCILIECKTAGANLDEAHASQLYRYFSVTEARFGVLTNGVEYRFFSDLEAANKMDSRPFLEFNVSNFSETASDLKYTKGIKRVLATEWVNPSDDLVKLLTAQVYSGRMTQSVREQFTAITKRAMQEFVSDRVSERLKTALAREEDHKTQITTPETEEEDRPPDESGVVTTEEEIEGFYVVKSIVREVVDAKRIFMRDTLSYCGVLLDDNNRKPICRLYFNGSQKYLGTFDESKSVTRHPIASVDEIFQYAPQLKETAARFA